MGGIRPKQLSRLGEFHLEEAVLDVLLEATHESKCMGAAAISKRAGIFRDKAKDIGMNDAIVTGVLIKLYKENKVVRCKQNSRGGWALSDEEFVRRRDDIAE